jgi:hypothetical protein
MIKIIIKFISNLKNKNHEKSALAICGLIFTHIL